MSAIPQTDRWIEFFRLYRQLPALWKVTDEVYKNKRLKKIAYDKLLACYQRIDATANVDSMRRRMNGIRTCYRRELRKVEHSELTANSADDVYVPHLWYFSELFFLRGHELRTPSKAEAAGEDETLEESNEHWDDISECETKFEQILEEPSRLDENPTPVVSHAMPQLDASSISHTQLLPQLLHNLGPGTRDEATVYAEGWAISYRKLDERNKLLAKKAIEEILVLGQLNKLEFNSVKMT